jgi:hypothetical protein
MAFNPNEHMMQLKSKEGSKDYLPVQYRLVWFREMNPQGTVDTEEVEVDLDRECESEVYVWNPEKKRSEKTIKQAKGYARFRAIVTDGKGGRATGTKSENAASFDDYIEKAETGAVGRALAMLGYGTAFAPELDEQHRLADSPIERNGYQDGYSKAVAQGSKTIDAETSTNASEQQVASIKKLCEHLGKPEPTETLTYINAKQMIADLSKEYREKRAEKPAEQAPPSIDESVAIKAKLESLMPRVRALGLASTYGGLYQRIGAEIGKEVKSSADLSLALLKMYEDKVFQLELQAATDRQKAS